MGNKTRYTANLVSDNNLFVDITNDRVGIGSTQPTAKLDVDGTLNVAGISTFTSGLQVPGGTGVSNRIELGNSQEFTFQYNTSSTKGIIAAASNPIDIQATTIKLLPNVGENGVIVNQNGSVELYHDNSKKFETTGYGVTVAGIVSATSFSGNGNDIVHSTWTLGANGSSHYTFTGPGGLSNTDDPKIYLARGETYEFVNNSGGNHPFQIQQSNGSAYGTGVTNNGASSGTIRFEVPFDAPNTLQYKCTNHSSMGNTIIVYPDISP